MANIFLDTNKVIDIAIRNPRVNQNISGHLVYISPLSIHILCYFQHIKIPDSKLSSFKNQYGLINLTSDILDKALTGPTSDLEDNIQLHSAIEADSDFFLTSDKKLLNMKYFGKTEIVSSLPLQVQSKSH